jgi:phage major head subunit gpT-like protein
MKAEKTKEFFDANLPVFREVDGDKDGIMVDYLTKPVKLTEELNEDILDPSQYSIQ